MSIILKSATRTINDRIAGIKMICLSNTDLDLRAAAYHLIMRGQEIIDACTRLDYNVYDDEFQRDCDKLHADELNYRDFINDSDAFFNGLY